MGGKTVILIAILGAYALVAMLGSSLGIEGIPDLSVTPPVTAESVEGLPGAAQPGATSAFAMIGTFFGFIWSILTWPFRVIHAAVVTISSINIPFLVILLLMPLVAAGILIIYFLNDFIRAVGSVLPFT